MYLLHFYLGLLATAGAIVVIIITLINELMTRKHIRNSSGWELADSNFSESSNRNAEAIIAMGMGANITRYWEAMRNKGLKEAQAAGNTSEAMAATTKTIRMILQSGILALGAYLAIFQIITPGTMIAASIISARALAPVDAAVGNWKNFVRARQAYAKLKSALAEGGGGQKSIDLPAPEGRISVSKVVKIVRNRTTGEAETLLNGIHFELLPGDGLGVIGQSASGKSTLARLLIGLSMPEKGEVRFDGAQFDQWDRDKVGKFIGYLPQSVELLSGTIAQNISRFDEGASDEDVVAAAKLAGAHELILKLSGGYSADLGSGQVVLSGGQAQRIALARAVYGKPPLVVLDEPNAHLDAMGDQALARAIIELRKAGSCVIVMAHRPSAIAAVSKLLMLEDGRQVEFGPKDEVLAKVTGQNPKKDT